MTYQDGQRMPTSAIRYTTRTGTQPRTPAPEPSTRGTQRMTYDIYADVEYNPVPARRGQPVLESASLPRPRPNTNQDTAIRTRVNSLKPALQPAQQPRRFGRRALIAGGIGTFFVGIAGGNWAINTVAEWRLEIAQGSSPVYNLELACGHGGDSVAHPTLLHAFIADYTLHVIEYPAGKNVGTHGETCLGLPTTGDVSRWTLGMEAQKVEGRWQVFITLQVPGESLLREWVLVDNGKYFALANPK